MGRRDLGQHLAPRRRRPRETVVPERAVSHDGYTVRLAPGQHRVLDGPLLQMIEHLIAGDPAARPGRLERFLEVVDVEITDTPGSDFAVAPEPLEGVERVAERIVAAPV